ncbi:MAG: outer membrane beta-barrel protein [Agriterribacter sp.]
MKNSLPFFLCFCLLILSESVSAQKNKIKAGMDVGYTYSNRQANLSNYINSKYTPDVGIGVNLSGEYLVWKTLFVSSGVSFLQKNYKYKRTGRNAGWYTKFKNSYLHFPVSVGGYLINNPHKDKGIWLRLSGGAYAEHWLSMRRDGQYPVAFQVNLNGTFDHVKVSERYDFKKNENQLKRFGYGLQGGGQLGYALKKFDMYAAYNYQYGLSDMNIADDNKNQKMTTQAFMISFGMSYRL